jgi:putative acetyltransferase
MVQLAALPASRPHVKFRPARLEDAAALTALRAAALRSIGEPYSSEEIAAWSEATGEAELRALIGEDDQGLICAVAEADESCVGFVRLGFGTSVHVLALYVDPAWQRRGIGAALLRAAHAICRARGVARVLVAASLNAAPFYARRGYVWIDAIDWHLTGMDHGPAIPAVRMTHTLR